MAAKSNIANDNLFNIAVTIEAMRELISILKEETSSLRNNKSDAVAKHYERKVDLVQYIQNQNETLKQYEQVRNSLPQPQKELLRNLAQELQEVISDNKDELEKAQLFNKELINLVVEAATSESVDVKTYNKAGNKKQKSSKAANTPAVSLNETV